MTPLAVPLSQAQALQEAGDWDAALQLYESVFQESVRDRNVKVMLASVRRLGYAHQLRGDVDLAADYLQLAWTLADIHTEHAEAARALNGLGTIYQHSGQISLAESTYDTAREAAEAITDNLAIADIEQNLGTLASLRSQHEKATRHYRTALTLYRETNNDRGVAQVLHNLGILYLDVGDLHQAEECIEAALGIFLQLDDQPSAGAAYLNRAEAHIHGGVYEQARDCCDNAFNVACVLDDSRLRAECHKYYGMVFRETTRFHRAVSHLQRAVSLARTYCLPLTEAEALRELGLTFRALERNAEALDSLNRSHLLFTELQAKADEADVSHSLVQLERDFQEIVEYWSASIEEKDQYTRGHCQRVANYACLLASSVGISQQDLVWFRMGAFLHDIGKMEVPESILHKRGVLTADERTIVERHAVQGTRLLAQVSFPWDICPMIRSHHERWDGNGYPDGLAGEAIPLAARILKLADVFDALTTCRSYRHPLSAEEARELMREDLGAFDPSIFRHFERLFPELASMVARQSEFIAALT